MQNQCRKISWQFIVWTGPGLAMSRPASLEVLVWLRSGAGQHSTTKKIVCGERTFFLQVMKIHRYLLFANIATTYFFIPKILRVKLWLCASYCYTEKRAQWWHVHGTRSSHVPYPMLFTAEPCPNMAEQCLNTFTSCARLYSCSSPLPHVMRFALAHSMFLHRLVFFNSFWIKLLIIEGTVV